MSETVKIIIPMAGYGTRLRPHTWSKPKQLVPVANKPVIGHLIDVFEPLAFPGGMELVFIIGYQGEKMQAYMDNSYPDLPVHYIEQKELLGQSHAIYQAKDLLEGPVIVLFGDTLPQVDLGTLHRETADGVVWVSEVEDPSSYGVAFLDGNGDISRLVEKPQTKENRLAAFGFYYFAEGKDLLKAIESQVQKNMIFKNEYYLVDAMNLMLERGERFVVRHVDSWLEVGTPSTALAANRHMLDHGYGSPPPISDNPDVKFIPPINIHPSAEIKSAVIGPYVSIASGCRVSRAVIRNSILEANAEVRDIVLEDSLVGADARLKGRMSIINAGDDTEIFI